VIRKGKNNPFYGKHHSEKTKEKIRIGLIGKVEGKNNPNYGNGNKIKGKLNPFYGKHHTNKTKKIISEKNKGKLLGSNHPNFIGNFEFFHLNYGKEICGMVELTKKYKLDYHHVWDICNKKRKSHHGWVCLGKIICT
jgi:hypothetical protein